MAQVKQSMDLPEEVWKEILLKLWLNEEDLEHVLICRKVCRLWEKLVDEMPPTSCWNPWLKHRMDEFRTAPFSIATIINSETDIRNFLSAGFASGRNPFRNHTLSIFLNDVKKEEEALLKIIEDHGQHVRKFLYRPTKDFGERLTNIPQLLTHMKNIRTLFLACGYLSTEQLMAIDGKDFPKDLNKLSELVLRREYYFTIDVEEDDRLYAKFSINYGSQIKSLTLDTGSLYLNRSKIMEMFPNLEDLGVKCVSIYSDVVVPPSRKEWPKLKRLALATSSIYCASITLKEMLKVAGCFAETLQLLKLGIDFDPFLNERLCKSNQTSDPIVITTFPKLKQLIIPLWTMRDQSQPINNTLETSFRCSLPNLKSLILEHTNDEFKNRDNSEAELEEICAPMWPLVPSSVETISVRIEKTSQVLLQDFPVVYKYKRNEALVTRPEND